MPAIVPRAGDDDDDDWETDPDYVNNMSEEQQRWGGARDTGILDMNQFREEIRQEDEAAGLKRQEEEGYKSSTGYGGKFGVMADRQDKSAMGWEYSEKIAKHDSQKDYKTGFGGQFGVQNDRQDKSAVGWDHSQKVDKHNSQTGKSHFNIAFHLCGFVFQWCLCPCQITRTDLGASLVSKKSRISPQLAGITRRPNSNTIVRRVSQSRKCQLCLYSVGFEQITRRASEASLVFRQTEWTSQPTDGNITRKLISTSLKKVCFICILCSIELEEAFLSFCMRIFNIAS